MGNEIIPSSRMVRRFSDRVQEVVRVNCFVPGRSSDPEGYVASFGKMVQRLIGEEKLSPKPQLEIMDFLGGRPNPHLLVGSIRRVIEAIADGLKRFRFPYDPKDDLLFPSLPSPSVRIGGQGLAGKISACGTNVETFTARENYWVVTLTFDPLTFRQMVKVEGVKQSQFLPADEFEDWDDFVATYGNNKEVGKALTDAGERLLWAMNVGFGKEDRLFPPDRCLLSIIRGEGAILTVSLRQGAVWQLVQPYFVWSEKKHCFGQNADKVKFVTALTVDPQRGLVIDPAAVQTFSSVTEFLVETDRADLLEALEAKFEQAERAIARSSERQNGSVNSELRDGLNGMESGTQPPTIVASSEPDQSGPGVGDAASSVPTGPPAETVKLVPETPPAADRTDESPATLDESVVAAEATSSPASAATVDSVVSESATAADPPVPAAAVPALAEPDLGELLGKPDRNKRANRRKVSHRHQGKNSGEEKE